MGQYIQNGQCATYRMPMNANDYQLAQETAWQQIQLQPDMIREGIRHGQCLERDAQKQRLREQNILFKQQARQKKYMTISKKDSSYLRVENGRGVLLAEKMLFRCGISQLLCYQFDEDDDYYWQVVLIEHNGNSEVWSPLYGSHMLKSPSKLKKTVLNLYLATNDSETCSIAWKWMFDLLNKLFDEADVTELPYKSGWFQFEERWRLWTNSETTFPLSDQVERFFVQRFEDLDVEETVQIFLNTIPGISDDQSIPAVLWTYHTAALLGRLTGAAPLGIGLTLIGEQSRMVAEKFVRTMENDMDLINLDSCSLPEIRKTAKLLQDTPMILVSSNPNSRSTQNRIIEVNSWIDTGYIGDKEVILPFVFCLQKFAKEYPLDSTIVVDTDKIKNMKNSLIFLRLQSLIISTVENSGTYWVDELRKEYACQAENVNTAMAVYRAVDNIILSMFDRDLGLITKNQFKKLIGIGESEIERQLSLQFGILQDVLRKKVWKMADENALSIVHKNECPKNSSNMQIYYDDAFYYFTRKVFDFICQKASIDTKTELAIKQQLVECGYIKLYKHSGTHNRELEIDITVCNCSGEKINISCLAIEREFFDELGGVALVERSDSSEAQVRHKKY